MRNITYIVFNIFLLLTIAKDSIVHKSLKFVFFRMSNILIAKSCAPKLQFAIANEVANSTRKIPDCAHSGNKYRFVWIFN